MGNLYLVDIDNTLLDCLAALEELYPGYKKEQQVTYEFNIDGVSAKDVIANYFSKYFYQRVGINKSIIPVLEGLNEDDKIVFVTYGDRSAKEFRVIEVIQNLNLKCELDLEVKEYPSGGSKLLDLFNSVEFKQDILAGFDKIYAIDDSLARLDAYKVLGVGYILVEYPYNSEYADGAVKVIKGY